ncbi:MAG: ABC transporter ATP-binding protein [Acidimicrobiia bacterium]|nr:ABC transporter ATP-binding protein [bacterium]MXZ30049.1 ABC transporter ATP-binding protein [Acidimicrobiia bacterium]MYB23503.1 ABC transporter ATP-binding protein [Acidimicrobiia bacterium]MYJ14517.1 ABC transporter ATP-binding protein [Acidimicrobiia bacterium]
MLEIESLRAGYGRLPVLFDIDLAVDEGEVLAIVGPNGAGKSTLLKSIIGVVTPTAGRIVFDGSRVTHEPPHLRVERGMALSPEGRRIFASLSVRENLLAGAARTPINVVEQQLQRIYTLFPILSERTAQEAGSLSGGEQQMLAIGRALISAPRMLLIDEPSMGLAPLIVAELYQALHKLAEDGIGIVVVDERSTEAISAADRVCVIEKGRIVSLTASTGGDA